MNLKPYPDSRVVAMEWAPVLPVHWRHTQLRHVSRIFAGGTPDRTNLDFWTDGTIPWLNSGSVNDGTITGPSAWITELASQGGRTRWVPTKSVLIALAGQGRTKGMVARLEIDSTCNQSMAAIVPTSVIEYRFVQFWLSSNYQNIRNLAGGDLRDGLNLQHIGGIEIPVPPLPEQIAISNYLDRETAEIDAFIADQEELIVLLNERRAATITQAVTKGLDPTVPMNETALGMVPANWSRMKLAWKFDFLNGDRGSGYPSREEFVSSGIPFINAGHLNDGAIDFSEMNYVTNEKYFSMSGAKLKAGDILYCLRGSLGKNAMIDQIEGGSLASSLVALRDRRGAGISTRYVFLLLNSHLEAAQRAAVSSGSAQPNMSVDSLRTFTFPLPPIETQQTIICHLDREVAEIDGTIVDAKIAITLSKERRAALISAAVTGKIDVRGAMMSKEHVLEGELVVHCS